MPPETGIAFKGAVALVSLHGIESLTMLSLLAQSQGDCTVGASLLAGAEGNTTGVSWRTHGVLGTFASSWLQLCRLV